MHGGVLSRSIAHAQYIIWFNTYWQIGRGTRVHIWDDKWANTEPLYKIVSPQQILPTNTRVSDLIEPSTMQWKTSLIDTVFMLEDAQKIKAIPLPQTHREDSLIWVGTTYSRFTTKTAYKFKEEAEQNKVGLTSNPRRTCDVRKSSR